MNIPGNTILNILPGISFPIHIHTYKKAHCPHKKNEEHIPKPKYQNTYSQQYSCCTADTFAGMPFP